MKKDKRERKMAPEQLQGLLHMRKRAFVQKNGKAYNRKQKHKGVNNTTKTQKSEILSYR